MRFIPACAGNACAELGMSRIRAVHPRVCGERGSPLMATLPKDGSSPRVRGTPGQAAEAGRQGRFIPACAGNARHKRSHCDIHAVHPRVCGERRSRAMPARPPRGSSPRVRGTHSSRPFRWSSWRFIPACAGNAATCRARPAAWPVHPRVCGERVSAAKAAKVLTGSSPRVRGTRCACYRTPSAGRFIPACAGNAFRVASLFEVMNGSSPRVRGTPNLAHALSPKRRFIPACAGNARSLSVLGVSFGGSSPRVRGTPRPRRTASA